MNELFGLPMRTLTVFFTGSLLLIAAWSLYLVVRQPVLFRLAARNIPRRWGRSLLIVLGLTLATTIIAAALTTGDTVTTTARTDVIRSLGAIDERISSREQGSLPFVAAVQDTKEYFDERRFLEVEKALRVSPLVDGVMPIIQETVSVQSTSQTEPRVAVLAADGRYMAGFGEIRRTAGGTYDLSQLPAGAVLLNEKAASELRASAGENVTLFASGGQRSFRVQDVVNYDGIGTADSGLIMTLAAGQSLFGKLGQIQHIAISNRGDAEGGVVHTDAVKALAEDAVAGSGLVVEETKREALDLADTVGAAFSTFFVTFGTFSIAAGVLLIFLLFVMLSAERRPEMGMARAVGTERIHLVEMFMLEGLLYDVAAAAVGALAGVGVAYVMVSALGSAMADLEVSMRFSVTTQSMVTAYSMGVVLTFVVVTLSAWRVSVLNIVSAIRNLPETTTRADGRASLLWGFVLLAAGVALTFAGLSGKQGMPFYLGVSLVIMAAIPLLRWSGVSDRVAFGLGGSLTVAWWLMPWSVLQHFVPEMAIDFNIWVVGGLVTVVGATWVVMYNSDVILGLALRTLGRFRGLAPILKTAIVYPLTNRFRTGVTLAMFTLVVFVLVTGGITTTAFTEAFNDVGLYGGGFDVRTSTVPANPVPDLGRAINSAPGLNRDDFEVIAGQSVASIEARQTDTSREFGAYPLRGVDDAFLDSTTYGFAAIAEGYNSPSEVWQALKANPRLAVVDDLAAQRRTSFNFGEPVPDFQLEGFFVEDGTFKPTPIQVRDPITGVARDLTVIAVLKDVVPTYMIGVTASQRFVAESFPAQAVPTSHLLRLRPGTDTKAVAEALESAFLANGMEAVVLREELDDLVALNKTFNYLIQGFVGLGLVVGVAALGVISARAVVERRQEIGVMRAIGFEQGRVQLSFLIESSMVAVAGIVLGTALGLVIGYNVISDSKEQASWENLRFTVPWVNLLIIYAIVMCAALAAAFIPARQASRVYPAEALRYE